MSMPNILVVESDANVRELAATFLRGPAAVAFADHGAAALGASSRIGRMSLISRKSC